MRGKFKSIGVDPGFKRFETSRTFEPKFDEGLSWGHQSLSEQIEGFEDFRTEHGSSQGRKLALTGLFFKFIQKRSMSPYRPRLEKPAVERIWSSRGQIMPLACLRLLARCLS